jgi:20S proteasome, alpha and beta subunits
MSNIYFLFSQGHVSAALVLGGVDDTGAHLFNIYPHGSSDTVPFCTMGSGSLAAMSVFESNWKPNMTVSEQKLPAAENFVIQEGRKSNRTVSEHKYLLLKMFIIRERKSTK